LGIGLNFFNNLIIAVISSTLVDKHGLQGDAFFGTFNLNPSMQTSDQVKGKPLDWLMICPVPILKPTWLGLLKHSVLKMRLEWGSLFWFRWLSTV